MALAHPECAMSFFHNDKEIFNLTSSTLKQRIVGIFGNRYNEKLVPVKEETSLVVVNGFVGKPEFSKNPNKDSDLKPGAGSFFPFESKNGLSSDISL